MAETIPQFYKRIQRCDPKLDATYSKGKEYFNIFSRQCNFGTVFQSSCALCLGVCQ